MSINIPKKVWFFLLTLTALRLIYVYFLPITPQEAYYWYYAQHPAISYFDHPPVAAYSIWISTHLFGDTVFGVKFMALLWSLATNIFLYLTVKRATRCSNAETNSEHLAISAIALYNLTLFAHLYALLIVPDTPLIFFWMLSIYFFQEIINTGRRRYWIYSGLAVGFGLLSKYTMMGILPAFFTVMLVDPGMRKWFRTIYPYLAIVLMIIVFAPVLIWNDRHNWVSFGFQFTERASHVRHVQSKYLGQLLASQLLMLTPLVLVYFVKIQFKLKTIWRERKSNNLYYYLTGLFLIGGFTLVSLRSLVKMNWLLPAYMGWLALAVSLFYRKSILRSLWFRTGLYFSLFLVLLLYSIQLIPNIPLGEGNTWSGWKSAAQGIYKLQKEKGGKNKCFLFANSYKSASLLKFYIPDQQETYAQNIYGRPALQFDIWGKPDSLSGKDALYVFTDRREYKNDLKYVWACFDTLMLLKKFEYTFTKNIHVRTIYCYYAQNYHPPQK